MMMEGEGGGGRKLETLKFRGGVQVILVHPVRLDYTQVVPW